MDYGKFNSAEELLKGYTELEKSYTQKCQELSALKHSTEQSHNSESGTSEQPSPLETSAQSTAEDKATVPTSSETDTRAESQRADVNLVAPPRIMTGGGNVSMALPNRPRTLKEASELAKKYFN